MADDDQQVDLPIVWPNEVHYCEELVYRLFVTNYRDVAIKCRVTFRPLTEPDSSINLFYPRGGFKAVIQPKSTKTILVLHKLRPVEDPDCQSEINKLEVEFRFK
jgi:hypothetical protein